MKKSGAILVAAALLFFKSTAHTAVWYVHPDSALNSIQAGLNLCATDDTVLVAAGTYYESLNWPTRAGINLLSESGPESTFIDGNSAARIITMPGSFVIDSTTVIKGFTLQHGYSASGGGISCFHASPKIIDNIFTNNTASGTGGAIHAHNANLVIVGNTISYNTAHAGGGIYLTTEDNNVRSLATGSRTPSIIKNNLISYNSAFLGGGICWYNEWGANIEGNIMMANHATYGGGVFCTYAESCIMSDNTISHNLADSIGGALYLQEYTGSIIHNTISGNNAGFLADGIYYTDGIGGSPLSINNNNICTNGCGLFNATYGGLEIDAEFNWWGDSTGPFHPVLNPYGQGDTVSDSIDFTPWLIVQVGLDEFVTSAPSSPPRIFQNIPNPALFFTMIRYSIPYAGKTTLKVYNLLGQEISVLVNEWQTRGEWAAIWDTRNVNAGVYFYQLNFDNSVRTKKCLVLK